MKQVSIDNLKENDILALPILSHGEAVLIHADVVLTHELIERVRNLGTKTVYIKDEEEGPSSQRAPTITWEGQKQVGPRFRFPFKKQKNLFA